MVEKSFTGAMKEFFGLKDGQNITGFAAELKALSDKDKQEFSDMLMPIIPHTPPVIK